MTHQVRRICDLFHLFTYSLWTFGFLDSKGIGKGGYLDIIYYYIYYNIYNNI